MKGYIPVELWRDSYRSQVMRQSFTFVERVPISKIKIDKSFFSWQNEISQSLVDFIVENFDADFWMPIIVNSDYFLLDGQHRLQVARKLDLEYIDVVIDKTR